jgi:L-malate glycosyltransferase
MNIAFIPGVFFPQPGGAQVQVNNFANKLIENGLKVDCLIYRKANIKNTNYNIIKINYFLTSIVYFFFYHLGINLNFIITFFLRRKIKKKKYDIWHFCFLNFKSLILINCLKKLDQKVIVTFQGIDVQILTKINYGYRLNKKYNDLLISTIKYIDAFTAISKNIEKDLIKLGVKKNRIFLIPNSVYLKKFKKTQIKKKKSYYIKFITVGRFAEKKKGFDLIKKIVPILNKKKIKFKWKIIGKGTNKVLKYKELKKNIDDFEIIEDIQNINELYFPNEELIKHYKSSDIYLNLSRIESFGITFIEALASNLPILSFNTKGIDELIVNNKNGFLINSFNYKKYVNVIDKISKNQISITKLETMKTVKNFDLDKNTKELIELYKKVLNLSI